MTNDQIASQEAKEIETISPDEGHQDEETQTEDSAQLKALLEKERAARLESEKKLEETRKKARERWEKKQENHDGQDDHEDFHGNYSDKLQQEVEKIRQEAREELKNHRISDLAKQYAKTSEEKELILEVYRNRTFPDHLSLEEAVEEAWIIANKNKLKTERAELLRAVNGRKSASNDFSTTHQSPLPSSAPKMAGADAQELVRAGYSWNSTNRRYEKKLPNGKTLVKEPGKSETYIV